MKCVEFEKGAQKPLYRTIFISSLMASDSVSSKTIADVCASVGLQLFDVTKIKKNVYTGRLTDQEWKGSNRLFVKVHSRARQSELEQFAQIATDVGHPECQLVGHGERLYLIMGQASGRPLSQLMPVGLLPGVWQMSKRHTTRAYHELGQYLGTLHTETADGTGPVLNSSERRKTLKFVNELQDYLDENTTTEIEKIVTKTETLDTPYAITYGDRSPHNIYYDGNTTTLIDANCTFRSAVTDHTRVLLGIRLMFWRLPYIRYTTSSVVEKAYWNGYAQTGLTASTEQSVVMSQYTANLVRFLHRYETRPHSNIQKIIKHIDSKFLYRDLNNVVSNYSLSSHSSS